MKSFDLLNHPKLKERFDHIIVEEQGVAGMLAHLNSAQGRLQDAKRLLWEDVYKEAALELKKFDGSYDRKTSIVTFTPQRPLGGKVISKRRR